jgi:hypothetical protein
MYSKEGGDVVIHVLARCFLISLVLCWLGAQAQIASPIRPSDHGEDHIEDSMLVLPDVQILQDRFSFFITREHDLFEYEIAEKLAKTLGKSSMNFSYFMSLLEKVIETIVCKNVESYKKDKIDVDIVGLKIQYMMLFLTAIFQDNISHGRDAFEFYIRLLGLSERE